ncbi:PLP-dependent aminotransferase family protein [Bordetella genomosp. 12]|uniref:MocR-like pyridoxine biosynthesis transcription factor PdxR n=1 Tax=Bordetella genomosp. 12 TaxID=463035 RepID=UPI001177F199|nr:PLP-dependent aminotransferase family protein [Bordetella genomosp. 12]
MKSLLTDVIAERFGTARDNHPERPLHALLFECLRHCVLDGSLPASSRLPPTRDLATQLALSRNTVAGAYDQLRAQGYTRAVTGSGTFISDQIPDELRAPTVQEALRITPFGRDAHAALSRRGRNMLNAESETRDAFGAFVPGAPDLARFPRRKFSALVAKWWKQAPPEALSYAPGGGHPALREALSRYLRQARSLNCEPDQIILTDGVQQALDLIVRLLGDNGDSAWIEDPGYWGVRSVLRGNGINPLPRPIDAQGMVIPNEVGPHAPQPRLIFVTPSHQYPLGAVMSVERRTALLQVAQRLGSWIVEDDYDSEFRFSNLPVLPLYGMATEERVIYTGTFSKTLYPGIRTAYMVVPRHLAAAFRRAQARLYRSGSLLMQLVLAEFVDTGQYSSYIREMRLTYAARRAFLRQLIEEAFDASWIHQYDTPAGLHLTLKLPQHVDDVALEAAIAQHGVQTRALSQYYFDSTTAEKGLLLGFAGTSPQNMRAPFSIVAQCVRNAAG